MDKPSGICWEYVLFRSLRKMSDRLFLVQDKMFYRIFGSWHYVLFNTNIGTALLIRRSDNCYMVDVLVMHPFYLHIRFQQKKIIPTKYRHPQITHRVWRVSNVVFQTAVLNRKWYMFTEQVAWNINFIICIRDWVKTSKCDILFFKHL